MKINIIEIPTCTWVLEGDSFFCTHDDFETIENTYFTMGSEGPVEYTSLGYQCVECGESVDGSPREDMLYEDLL